MECQISVILWDLFYLLQRSHFLNFNYGRFYFLLIGRDPQTLCSRSTFRRHCLFKHDDAATKLFEMKLFFWALVITVMICRTQATSWQYIPDDRCNKAIGSKSSMSPECQEAKCFVIDQQGARMFGWMCKPYVHVAANLLKGEYSNKKWKSLAPGEKQISLVVQLEKPSKITSIDIGNENSAFIEILVAKSSTGTEDYKVLLAATSLMTLKEAKFSTNTNAVKFIKAGDLCEDVRNDKWDRVKMVCTQHYNTVTQFGLSFIVFHTDEASPQAAAAVSPTDITDLGKFHLKPQDTGQQVRDVVSAWAKKKEQAPDNRGAAAVNAAVRFGDIKLPSAKNAPIVAKVSPLTANDSEEPVKDVSSTSSGTPARKQRTPKAKPKDDGKAKAPKRNVPSPANKDSPKKKPKIAVVTAIRPPPRPRRPFNRLMEDVVFVISGFQNPLRSDIRNSALAMGAKYKADWDRSCTHLICAFPNTPKFNQVRGQGKIIKKEWVEECYESRKRLPWRRFALDTRDLIQPESEDEIWEDTGPVPPPMDNRRRLNDSSSEDDEVEKEVKRIKKQQTSPKKVTRPQQKVSPSQQNGPSDDEGVPGTSTSSAVAGPSGLRLLSVQDDSDSEPNPGPTASSSSLPPDRSIYEVDTEDEADGGPATDVLENLPRMPSFFESYNFLILDDIEESVRIKLKRYITARLGNIVTDVQQLNSSNPSYCITEDVSRLEEVRDAFPDVTGVRPDWIWFCHDENRLEDAAPFSL